MTLPRFSVSRILIAVACVCIAAMATLALVLLYAPQAVLPTNAQPTLPEQRWVLVGSRKIPVEVARTNEETRRGLSFRSTLPEEAGMYFAFPVAEPLTFWMYGMQFPIDMIFIRDGVVVNVAANVPHPQGAAIPATASSDGPADAVLELNAGKASEWGIMEGTTVGWASEE